MPDNENEKKGPLHALLHTVPWYYWTRTLGSGMILYGLFGDHSAERSTIILTGAGIMGLDKVARSSDKG